MTGPEGEPESTGHSTPAGDQPLDELRQDGLGREGFVELLADEIRFAPGSGFVVGVTGSWGSGKTSVINMAVNLLEEQPGYRILRFNPWLFSGTPQLVEHFFTELAAQLREAGLRRKGERLTTIGETIEQYGNLLDPLRFAPGVDTAVKATRFAGRVLRHAGGGSSSARDKKSALDKLLREHDERLIVVIDDIDRLEDGEIRNVMRLVRLVGDFPNVVYVLAFATDIVARALGGAQLDPERAAFEGHAYLEKIVQVTHAVPSIDREAMSTLLVRRLEDTLRGVPYELDPEHWSAVYSSIRAYFRNMRDVLRYCNAVRAPARHLIADVDVADIVGLEALRLFEPAVWEGLSPVSGALTSMSDSYMIGSDRTADEERIKGLLTKARDARAVGELLSALFPAATRVLGGATLAGGEWYGDWRRKGRVAHPEVLRVYLARQVAADQASRADARAAVEAMGAPAALRRVLEGITDERLPSLLSRVEDYEEDLPIESVHAIPVLYQLLARLPQRGPGWSDVEPETRIRRVVYRILKGHSPTAIAAATGSVIAELDTVSNQISVLRAMGWQSERADKLVDEQQLDVWARAAAEIASGCSAEQLALEPDLGMVVTALRDVHGQEAVNQWARDRVGHAPFFLRLLTTYMREVRSSAGRTIQLRWDRLSELLGEQLLSSTIQQLPSDDDWLASLGADEKEMVNQGRQFAADPEFAQRTMEDYRRRYS